MTSGFVFIHGAWHDHHAWSAVLPLLEASGAKARAVDLPGAGVTAPAPAAYAARPLDLEAFRTEPSPIAHITQADRTDAVIAAVRALNAQTGAKPVLVGHSLGGVTVSNVAEAIPEEIGAAVYLAAYLLPPGATTLELIVDPSMAGGEIAPLLFGSPRDLGALRIDPRSEDPDYRAKARSAFYHDLDDATFETAMAHLTPDEPAGVFRVPSPITQGRFGAVPRAYIECTDDRTIPVAGQREMLRRTDAALGSATTVYSMPTSHSPFYSAPADLARILMEIAAG